MRAIARQYLFLSFVAKYYLKAVSNIFVSLFLAAFMSFAAPVMLIGFILGTCCIFAYVPGLWELSNQMTGYIVEFLATFGNGKPFQGVITLGATVSIVGVLLDILNFYRYQSLKDQDIS